VQALPPPPPKKKFKNCCENLKTYFLLADNFHLHGTETKEKDDWKRNDTSCQTFTEIKQLL
jgi:hypothetical protein